MLFLYVIVICFTSILDTWIRTYTTGLQRGQFSFRTRPLWWASHSRRVCRTSVPESSTDILLRSVKNSSYDLRGNRQVQRPGAQRVYGGESLMYSACTEKNLFSLLLPQAKLLFQWRLTSRSSHQFRTRSKRLICNPEMRLWYSYSCGRQLFCRLLPMSNFPTEEWTFVRCPRKLNQIAMYNELYVFWDLANRRACAPGEWASACSDYLSRPSPPLIRQEFSRFSMPRFYYSRLAHMSNAPKAVYGLYHTKVLR